MVLTRFRTAALLLAVAAGTSACTDGYGYGGLDVGVGVGNGYYDPYYGDYGYGYGGYGSPYWGWNDGFYYPGTGIYVYDSYRRPYRWNDYQRRYWSDRRNGWRGPGRDGIRDNWRDFPRNRDGNGNVGNGRNWGDRDGRRGDWRNGPNQGSADGRSFRQRPPQTGQAPTQQQQQTYRQQRYRGGGEARQPARPSAPANRPSSRRPRGN